MPKSNHSQEVIIVGEDFTPGPIANSEIDSLLGYNTCVLENDAIRSETFGCSQSPNYCEDGEITRQELDKLEIETLITPILHSPTKKQKTKNPLIDNSYNFTATFICDGELYMTTPLESEELALACALWYVLAYHY